MHQYIRPIIFLIVLSAMAPCLRAEDTANPPDMTARTAELKSLHWGMFVCWSLSTFSGQEWTSGVKDISLFRATADDTDQWAQTAKAAGMGYILFLTKHHDGFCLWDTKTTDRKVTNAPLHRRAKLRRQAPQDRRRNTSAGWADDSDAKSNRGSTGLAQLKVRALLDFTD